MLQLEPRKNFPIVRQLDDPLDTNTYYVRAYIRDSYSNTLLDTVDLVDKTGQRFTYNYKTPADKSGEGTFIDITTKVFTDAAYSSESDVYARERDTFLIKETWNRIHNPGGGDPLAGPHEPDYAGFGKIVDKRIKGIKFPKQEKVDLTPVIDAINNIHIPDPIIPEKFPIGAITRLIEQVRMKVEALPKPIKPEKVDLSGIVGQLNTLKELVKKRTKFSNDLARKNRKQLKSDIKKSIDKFADVKFTISGVGPLKKQKTKKKKDEKPWRKYY